MKNLTVLLAILIGASQLEAQDQGLEFVGQASLCRGMIESYNDYTWSSGSGIMIEAGLGKTFAERIQLFGTLGYQASFSFESTTSSSAGSSSYSSTFGRGVLTIGGNYLAFWNDRVFRGFVLGAGLNYNMPGKLKMSTDNQDFGAISYQNSLGWFTELLVALDFGDKISLRPGLRFRNAKFYVDDWQSGTTKDLPESLQRLMAWSLDTTARVIVKF